MKKNYNSKALTFLFFLALTVTTFAQTPNNYWKSIDASKALSSEKVFRQSQPFSAFYYQLDLQRFSQLLQNAPIREGGYNQSGLEIVLPNSKGDWDSFRVMEASILDEELQSKYPDIKSYVGQGVDNQQLFLRFSLTPSGLHSMTLGSSQGTQFIDPFSISGNIYVVYSRNDLNAPEVDFICEVNDELFISDDVMLEMDSTFNANDGILRTYRLALACTEEYSAFHVNQANLNAGTDAQKKAAVLAAMVVTMTRVNGVYERDLSLTMTIVPNNETIIFLSGDPFSNNNANALINESQSIIDAFIGSPNYDIGHTFSTGGGGLAGLNVPCVAGSKARGITGLPAPIGDPFNIDFVAHEIGHQFGSPHTFNGSTGNCSGSNRTATSAYEPGSGSTIMAYAGICAPQNVQNNSDAYFHQRSLQLIWANISAGNSSTCPQITITGNSAPTAEAGLSYTIPIGTPYKLTGFSSDIDGIGTHTYTWEQYDLGPAGIPFGTDTQGPLVRSFLGTSNPTRFIPRLPDILVNGGNSTTWEVLPLVTRQMNFRLTVRDNDIRGGQNAVDNMIVTSSNTAGPFRVTSQNTPNITWTPGALETITWDVANTNGVDINTSNVNILLSIDGGQNFDIVLASNTPNDGSHVITVPNVFSANSRIMVEAVGNIFFNVNLQSFTIGELVCNDFSSVSNLNLQIPDGLGTTSANPGASLFNTINVADNVTIESLKFSVNISHTWVGDLLVRLIHPNNIDFVNAWVGNCGSNDGINVVFQDGSPAIVCGNPTAGTYAPVESLSAFNGLSSQGDWRIQVVDFFQGDIGVLNNWSIEICSAGSLSINDNLLENLVVYPNPNKGSFNVSFNSHSGENIAVEVFDIQGRIIFYNEFNTTNRFNELISLKNAQSGMYILKITDGNQSSTKKIIVD